MSSFIDDDFQAALSGFMSLSANKSALNQLVGLLSDNIKQEQLLMSQITDWAATEQADLTKIASVLTAIQTGVNALDTDITNLQQQLSASGALSAADTAALTALKASSAALVTQASAISVAPPAGSPPSPLPPV